MWFSLCLVGFLLAVYIHLYSYSYLSLIELLLRWVSPGIFDFYEPFFFIRFLFFLDRNKNTSTSIHKWTRTQELGRCYGHGQRGWGILWTGTKGLGLWWTRTKKCLLSDAHRSRAAADMGRSVPHDQNWTFAMTPPPRE